LNVIYSILLERLNPEEGESLDSAKRKLDDVFEVATWNSPFKLQTVQREVTAIDVPEGKPPAWWHGDEEASQGFLRTMGVNL
jgi:hypothetical protein